MNHRQFSPVGGSSASATYRPQDPKTPIRPDPKATTQDPGPKPGGWWALPFQQFFYRQRTAPKLRAGGAAYQAEAIILRDPQVFGQEMHGRAEIRQIENGDQTLLTRWLLDESRRLQYPELHPVRWKEQIGISSSESPGIELARELCHPVLSDHRGGSDPQSFRQTREKLTLRYLEGPAFVAAGLEDHAAGGQTKSQVESLESLVDTGDFEIKYSDAFNEAKG